MKPNVASQPKSLLMTLTRPASLQLGYNSRINLDDHHLRIGDVSVVAGYPDNLSLPDVLYDVSSHTFVGLAFNSTDWTGTLTLFRELDDRVVHFARDGGRGRPGRRLDVRWGISQNTACEGAQIADILFFFKRHSDGRYTELVALELGYIAEILSGYKLAFPTSFNLQPDEVAGEGARGHPPLGAPQVVVRRVLTGLPVPTSPVTRYRRLLGGPP